MTSTLWRRSGCHLKQLIHSPQRKFRISAHPTFQRIIKTLQNDPFIKLSVSLCVLIGSGTLIMELYKRWKRGATHKVCMFPSTFAHYSVSRQPLVSCMNSELKSLQSKLSNIPPLLYVTGPPGCGKTELARQFCNYFASTPSKKWLGLKSIPSITLCVDAGSECLMQQSLLEITSRLGLLPNRESGIESLLSATLTELESRQLPWLLVFDHLSQDTAALFQVLVSKHLSKTNPHLGVVLVTTQFPPEKSRFHSVCEVSSMNLPQSIELLEQISGLHNISSASSVLLQNLCYNPMAIALAASTMKRIYSTSNSEESSVAAYQDLLAQELKSSGDVQKAAMNLYFEAAVSDPRVRHAFDFLGSCDLNYPIPTMALLYHLSHNFYGMSAEELAPALAPHQTSQQHSYWARFKSKVPFLQTSVDSVALSQPDEVAFIRHSPILSFKRSGRGDVEVMTVHSVVHHQISKLFDDLTVPMLNKDFLAKELNDFEHKSWFKSYRAFDYKKALRKFHRMLPGLSSPGVLTEAQFLNSGQDTKMLDYSCYVHHVSHHHRVLSSLVSVFRSVKEEAEDCLIKKCLLPHFQAIRQLSSVSKSDKLTADISLVAVKAATAVSAEERVECINQYENLISEQRALVGTKNVELASSMVDLADLHMSLNNVTIAQELLQSALDLYNQIPVHLQHDVFTLDKSHALSSLGLVCSELGEKEKSKDYYDQALLCSQSVPTSGRVGPQQRKLVASLLVNVTHAYLSLGDLPMAKKYGDLAALMLQSVYPQGHVEIIRLFNIRSIISALLGDKEESSKSRLEASKLKLKLDNRA